ncbi:MAG: tRNA (N6-threonylcarbamoyladenosine(37)-N6)-methyltransferase TrmO [Clostridiales bacterium]|nr:tRNA (N6-threonylcarbamoyladenosine(37)-N6)-methyltransferase TrmO [Clostridiales bacterium]
MDIIAQIKTDFPIKFGVPRQSGLVESLQSKIIFEPKYRNPDCVKGLEGFSHIWLLWVFSEIPEKEFSPTVRPPRLGGNTHVGVFASRSPFRPNNIGLSSVRLDKIEYCDKYGPVLYISGADMTDNTPIADIKPYLPYTDSHSDAVGGFADSVKDYELSVELPDSLLDILPAKYHSGIRDILAQDPRPSYQNDPERVYGFEFSDYEIKFTVNGSTLTVKDILKKEL